MSDIGPGRVLLERYEIIALIGTGSFGEVFKAIDRTDGATIAVKVIDLDASPDELSDIEREVSLLAGADSPHVVGYRSSHVCGSALLIVMEYLAGGSVLDLLRPAPLDEAAAAVVVRGVLKGLDYLHGAHKIHRDIKAANIFVDPSGAVKLGDFGVAGELSNRLSKRISLVGTPFWMAPEVIRQAEGYDTRADIWSLGITLYEMLEGNPPHAGEHPVKVLFRIPELAAPSLPGGHSKAARDFFEQCCRKDPLERPSAKELLKHRFVTRAKKDQYLAEVIRVRMAENMAHPPPDLPQPLPLPPVAVADSWDFGTVKHVKTAENEPKTAENEPKLTENEPKTAEIGSKTTENARKMPENAPKRAAPAVPPPPPAYDLDTAKSGQIRPKMTENGPKSTEIGSKTAEIGSKTAENGAKMAGNGAKMAENGQKWPKVGQTVPGLGENLESLVLQKMGTGSAEIFSPLLDAISAIKSANPGELDSLLSLFLISGLKTAENGGSQLFGGENGSKMAENGAKMTENGAKMAEIGPAAVFLKEFWTQRVKNGGI